MREDPSSPPLTKSHVLLMFSFFLKISDATLGYFGYEEIHWGRNPVAKIQ
jgi:hypothetical protein